LEELVTQQSYFNIYQFFISFYYYSQKFKSGTPAMAKICKSTIVDNPDPLVIADFSGRGLNPIRKDILKVI